MQSKGPAPNRGRFRYMSYTLDLSLISVISAKMSLWSFLCFTALAWSVSAQSPTCQLQSVGGCVCGDPNVHSYCGSTSCAPEDRLVGNPTDNCRINEFFAPDHILPEEWELMFDSYEYQNLWGSVFLNREFDNDGTGVSNKAAGNS